MKSRSGLDPTEFYDAAEFLSRFQLGEETVLSQLRNMAGTEMQLANYHGFYINTHQLGLTLFDGLVLRR